MRLFGPISEIELQAIAGRLRTIVGGHRVELIAEEFALPLGPLRALLEAGQCAVDPAFVIDVIAATVHRWGIDPKWLLTGEYDTTLHRQALVLGEDRSRSGVRSVRELVEGEYRKLRTPRRFLTLPFMYLPALGRALSHVKQDP